jgi:hypothetical protein
MKAQARALATAQARRSRGCDRWVVAGIMIAVTAGAVLAWRPGTVTAPALYQPNITDTPSCESTKNPSSGPVICQTGDQYCKHSTAGNSAITGIFTPGSGELRCSQLARIRFSGRLQHIGS